ncbi:ATP-binding protein [Spirosoma aerophilum]
MERKTFPGTFDSLEGIRQVVKEEARQAGLSKKATYNLMLAIDEIATNIIMHGYEENNLEGPIDVLSEFENGALTVTLEDDAPPFDPLQRESLSEEFFARPLEERPIGGMGIHLTIKAVDEFKYTFSDNRNHNIFIVKTDSIE